MILLTDRNGHVGRVDVQAHDSSAPPVQLASAGAAAASSSQVAAAVRVEPAALAHLESVAHVRGDQHASLTTELDARAIATTLEPLVSGTGAAPAAPTVVASDSPSTAAEPQTPKHVEAATPASPTPMAAHPDEHGSHSGQPNSSTEPAGQSAPVAQPKPVAPVTIAPVAVAPVEAPHNGTPPPAPAPPTKKGSMSTDTPASTATTTTATTGRNGSSGNSEKPKKAKA
jgi:hypothetical protein